jgi:hypothetical protein
MFLACAESEALILVEYQSEHHDSNPDHDVRFGIPPISKLLILRKPKTWYFVEGLTEVSAMFLACAESEALILVEYQSEHHDSNPEGKNCTPSFLPSGLLS